MSTKRMGRPPAGPGGMKVEDLPRVTIRLEPELLERARSHVRETRQPLWRLVQQLLRAYLEQTPQTSNDPPLSSAPPPAPGERPSSAPQAAAAAEPQPQPHTHALPLIRHEIEALREALHWHTSVQPLNGDERKAVTNIYERTCAHSEQLFRLGLDQARRRPRGATSDLWELTLEDCRRLRRVTRQFLAAGKERTEAEIALFFYGKDPMSVPEQAKHHKRIRREVRTANGALRAVRNKIPWR